jgi:hypothetical protein
MFKHIVMKMEAKEIHPGQWIADNNVIRPCIEGLTKTEGHHDISFESFANQHTYATDLTGTFSAEQLGEVVWQYRWKLGSHGDQWFDTALADSGIFKSFAEYQNETKENIDTRQFLTTKQMSKEPAVSLDLSAVMYFRSHAAYQGNGYEQYCGTIDSVIELMVGFHKSQL